MPYALQALIFEQFQRTNFSKELPNGLRCPHAFCGVPVNSGTRQRRFDGTNCKPRKLSENAQTPATVAPRLFVGDRVHTLLGVLLCKPCYLEKILSLTFQPRLTAQQWGMA